MELAGDPVALLDHPQLANATVESGVVDGDRRHACQAFEGRQLQGAEPARPPRGDGQGTEDAFTNPERHGDGRAEERGIDEVAERRARCRPRVVPDGRREEGTDAVAPIGMWTTRRAWMERLVRTAPRAGGQDALVAGQAEQGYLAAEEQAPLLGDRVEDVIEISEC